MRKFKRFSFFWILAALLFSSAGYATDPVVTETLEKAGEPAPKSELDKLKAEWEAVREQQVQMIREKQDQLEKLKDEIFSKMKIVKNPDASQDESQGLEAQKRAFQAERQKFSEEMDLQKENLRRLQAALDEKAEKLEAERARFEQEKKTAAPQVP
jgi:septal ring factor EnvC (AmiA/AmiB activator)